MVLSLVIPGLLTSGYKDDCPMFGVHRAPIRHLTKLKGRLTLMHQWYLVGLIQFQG